MDRQPHSVRQSSPQLDPCDDLAWSNVNSLWSAVVAHTLARLGLRQAVICPGSRSTPLTLALVRQPQIATVPVLDERSAAFFALGIAKASGRPVAVVCTSGTAGANFFPAVIEAKETGVPLLLLTADRPPELRQCHSGQTIDQGKLFGDYAQWYSEIAVPAADFGLLAYLRQTLVQAWRRAQFPQGGAVHLNFPFRDPLEPIADGSVEHLRHQWPANFFELPLSPPAVTSPLVLPLAQWRSQPRGVIIGGIAQPGDPQAYGAAVARLSEHLQYPVIAEALSPLRHQGDRQPHLITTYDFLLRHDRPELCPEVVIQLGPLPTSKVLRQWLGRVGAEHWVIGDRLDNFDPLHQRSLPLVGDITTLGELPPGRPSDYLNTWQEGDRQARQRLAQVLDDASLESQLPPLMAAHLPPQTPILIANSLAVRQTEWFWPVNDRRFRLFCNRGANGIDGTLSTALGIAQASDRPAVLVTGDLALLHDSNGFLLRSHLRGSLTILLVNNQGGGIFEYLPIAQWNPPFEDYFATPQTVEFAQLARLHQVAYHGCDRPESLIPLLHNLPPRGIQLIEIPSDRRAQAQWFRRIAPAIGDPSPGT